MNETKVAAIKVGSVWSGTVATWTLTEYLSAVATLIGICVGLATFVYTGLQIYVLWRDKIKKKD